MWFSAPPPPLQAGTFSRGVVTMRCDVTTCSFAHISLLVSGSAQTCFDDQVIQTNLWQHFLVLEILNSYTILFVDLQLLENHIKNEIIEKVQLVHALPDSEENKITFSEPRRSASIACGAAVFEVRMKVPSWASQVFQLTHYLPLTFWM